MVQPVGQDPIVPKQTPSDQPPPPTWIPNEGCEGKFGNPLYYSDDLGAAKKCVEELEKLNPAKTFQIVDHSSVSQCEGQACPPADYYIEEGLYSHPFGTCEEGKGGVFYTLLSSANEENAKKCAHDLNRIEAAKDSGLECRAKNVGGTVSDTWEVTCTPEKIPLTIQCVNQPIKETSTCCEFSIDSTEEGILAYCDYKPLVCNSLEPGRPNIQEKTCEEKTTSSKRENLPFKIYCATPSGEKLLGCYTFSVEDSSNATSIQINCNGTVSNCKSLKGTSWL